MNTPHGGKLVCHPDFLHRRRFLMLAGVGAVVIALPAATLANAGVASAATSNADSPPAATTLGTKPAVALLAMQADRRLCVVAESTAASPSPQEREMEFRILGAAATLPLGLIAHYPAAASHRFWHAWAEGRGSIQTSPAAVIRWLALRGAGLPLSVRVAGQQLPLTAPATPGTYVLAIADRALNAADLQDMSIAAVADARTPARLVRGSDEATTDLSYLVFSIAARPS